MNVVWFMYVAEESFVSSRVNVVIHVWSLRVESHLVVGVLGKILVSRSQ